MLEIFRKRKEKPIINCSPTYPIYFLVFSCKDVQANERVILNMELFVITDKINNMKDVELIQNAIQEQYSERQIADVKLMDWKELRRGEHRR